jgi:hypothetical protein
MFLLGRYTGADIAFTSKSVSISRIPGLLESLDPRAEDIGQFRWDALRVNG